VETDLRKLVDSVVKDQQLTTRRHTVTIKGPESLAVRADPTRFKQVMNNLISNAIKYSPQGGPIEVRLWANSADKTALIYVRDHGMGVDPADVPKLFDRFSRVQRKETMAIPGSGLGLYIAHHIIEAHGGTLTLQPAPGNGTIAEVTVPLSSYSGTSGLNSGPLVPEGNPTDEEEPASELVQVVAQPDGALPLPLKGALPIEVSTGKDVLLLVKTEGTGIDGSGPIPKGSPELLKEESKESRDEELVT
jgi:anti-sigma regulatory factor (Ser/Thr protein kinase)